MRLMAGTGLFLRVAGALPSDGYPASTGLSLATLAAAMLVLPGLWTPVAGALVAIAAAWHGAFNPSNLSFDVLLGGLGIALALLGPGAWSVDARLFGWKRFEIQRDATTKSTPGGRGDDSSSL